VLPASPPRPFKIEAAVFGNNPVEACAGRRRYAAKVRAKQPEERFRLPVFFMPYNRGIFRRRGAGRR
jgi:hypothetical protein